MSETDLPLPRRARFETWMTSRISTFLTGIAFYSAIAMPICYLPFLAFGVSGRAPFYRFLAVIALNYLALFVGMRYGRSD